MGLKIKRNIHIHKNISLHLLLQLITYEFHFNDASKQSTLSLLIMNDLDNAISLSKSERNEPLACVTKCSQSQVSFCFNTAYVLLLMKALVL